MIFPRQFLAEELDKKIKKALHEIHPFETFLKKGDKSPAELILMNYYTFFDLKSNEIKELAYNARKEIAKDCFNKYVLDVFPNSGKMRNVSRESITNI